MNKSKKLKIVILAFAFSMAFISTVVFAEQTNNNNASEPGTSGDPLITLSYVTEVLKPQIEAEILAAVSGIDVSAILGSLAESSTNTSTVNTPSSYTGNDGETPTNTVPAASSYEVIEVFAGQKIQPVSGSLELIARQGTMAAAVTPYESQGISDLTDGTEILNGEEIPINHSLLIPRADGRSVHILSDVAYVMVRGAYEIVK